MTETSSSTPHIFIFPYPHFAQQQRFFYTQSCPHLPSQYVYFNMVLTFLLSYFLLVVVIINRYLITCFWVLQISLKMYLCGDTSTWLQQFVYESLFEKMLFIPFRIHILIQRHRFLIHSSILCYCLYFISFHKWYPSTFILFSIPSIVISRYSTPSVISFTCLIYIMIFQLAYNRSAFISPIIYSSLFFREKNIASFFNTLWLLMCCTVFCMSRLI